MFKTKDELLAQKAQDIELSEADAKDFLKLMKQYERGELELIDEKELKSYINEILIKQVKISL